MYCLQYTDCVSKKSSYSSWQFCLQHTAKGLLVLISQVRHTVLQLWVVSPSASMSELSEYKSYSLLQHTGTVGETCHADEFIRCFLGRLVPTLSDITNAEVSLNWPEWCIFFQRQSFLPSRERLSWLRVSGWIQAEVTDAGHKGLTRRNKTATPRRRR